MPKMYCNEYSILFWEGISTLPTLTKPRLGDGELVDARCVGGGLDAVAFDVGAALGMWQGSAGDRSEEYASLRRLLDCDLSDTNVKAAVGKPLSCEKRIVSEAARCLNAWHAVRCELRRRVVEAATASGAGARGKLEEAWECEATLCAQGWRIMCSNDKYVTLRHHRKHSTHVKATISYSGLRTQGPCRAEMLAAAIARPKSPKSPQYHLLSLLSTTRGRHEMCQPRAIARSIGDAGAEDLQSSR